VDSVVHYGEWCDMESVVRCGQNDVFSVKVEGKQKATVDCIVYKSHPCFTYTRTPVSMSTPTVASCCSSSPLPAVAATMLSQAEANPLACFRSLL